MITFNTIYGNQAEWVSTVPSPRCYCVCHNPASSCAWCEHCNGNNATGVFWRRRRHWYWKAAQDASYMVRKMNIKIRNLLSWKKNP